MFDIGNVLELKTTGKENKGGEQQGMKESHYCDLGCFYPNLKLIVPMDERGLLFILNLKQAAL